MAAWLLLLVIAVAAIMPHAQERSKRGCEEAACRSARFPQSGMVRRRKMFPRDGGNITMTM
jgi:hypothetical protein